MINPHNFVIVTVSFIIKALGSTPAMYLQLALLADVYDHQEALHGFRTDGFSMTITVPSNYTPHVNTATVLVELLREIGVKATVQPVDWSTWLEEVYSNRNFQSTVTGLTSDNMTARKLLERFGSTVGNNFTNYSNADEYYSVVTDMVKTAKNKGMNVILVKQQGRHG